MQLVGVLLAIALMIAVSGCIDGKGPGRRTAKMELIGGVVEETLGIAREQSFDYKVILKSALNGDREALDKLMAFGQHCDAAASMGHGVVLAYLIQELGDRTFAEQIVNKSNKVKKTMLAQLEAGLNAGPRSPNIPLSMFAPLTYNRLTAE